MDKEKSVWTSACNVGLFSSGAVVSIIESAKAAGLSAVKHSSGAAILKNGAGKYIPRTLGTGFARILFSPFKSVFIVFIVVLGIVIIGSIVLKKFKNK